MGWAELTAAANAAVGGSLGEVVLYYPLAGGGPIELFEVFDLEFEEVQGDTGANVLSQKPNLLVRLSKLAAAPAEGDRFVARGLRYAVDEVQADGVGTVLVFGKRAED